MIMGTIRILLALAVLVGHSNGLQGLRLQSGISAILPSGQIAVQAFYLISGFYMSLVLTDVYRGTGWIKAFWLSRYLRLAPVYLLLSIVSFALIPNLTSYETTDAWLAILAFLSNLTLIGQDLFVFFAWNVTTGDAQFMPQILRGALKAAGPDWTPGWALLQIEQGWSIGVEVWFYLLAPFLLTRSVYWIFGGIIVSVGIRLTLASALGWDDDPWDYRFFPSELFVFLTGSLAHRLYRNGSLIVTKRHLGILLWVVVVALTIFHTVLPGGSSEKRWAYLLILALSLPSIFYYVKAIKWDRWIGELSYPIYLVHFIPLTLMESSIEPLQRGWYNLGASVLLAVILVICIDTPMDKWRHRLVARMQARTG